MTNFLHPPISRYFSFIWKKNLSCEWRGERLFRLFFTCMKRCEGGYFRLLPVALSSLRKYWINEVTSEVVRVLLLLYESLAFRRRRGLFLSTLRFCRDGKDVERLVSWKLVRSIWTVRVDCLLALILLFLG